MKSSMERELEEAQNAEMVTSVKERWESHSAVQLSVSNCAMSSLCLMCVARTSEACLMA